MLWQDPFKCVQNMKELSNLIDEFLNKNNKSNIFLSDFHCSLFEHYWDFWELLLVSIFLEILESPWTFSYVIFK